MGEKKLMILDSTSIKNGRIETNSPPWPGCTAEGIYTMMLNQSLQLAFITGLTGAPGCAASAMDMTFIVGQDRRFIMPVPINRDFTLTIKDTDTGETLYKKTMPGPTSIGQAFSFGTVSDDKEPAWIKHAAGVAALSFEVGALEVVSGGITITPHFNSSNGEIDYITVAGEAETAVITGDNDLPGRVRIFKLSTLESAKKEYFQVDYQMEVNKNGSFSGTAPANKGDRFILTIEQGDIPLGQEFMISFSEPLDSEQQPPIEIYEKSAEGRTKHDVNVLLLETGTEVRVQTAYQFKENTRYEMRINGVVDRAGNPLNLTCDFRTKKSNNFKTVRNLNEVYDTLLIGGKLFVAAGQDGLKVYNVSNPAQIDSQAKPAFSYRNFVGAVRGLGLYEV
ncbi:MAG: Ig-like domain-containing protein, partial [Desulfobacteraceae bacterium]|nr:Ig-like domain-containing protein [Desulfobacteraceae bacterium]